MREVILASRIFVLAPHVHSSNSQRHGITRVDMRGKHKNAKSESEKYDLVMTGWSEYYKLKASLAEKGYKKLVLFNFDEANFRKVMPKTGMVSKLCI